ncbi:MAG: MarR family winged helix-turn-helix transcriptional regulator [Ruminiclostridium sp.]
MLPKEDLNNISNDLLNLVFLLTARIFNPSQMAKGMPFPHSHMKVILHIVMSGPCPVSKIANELIISKPNMTPIIDNLISDGYVNRYDDPNDRRVIMIEATEKAHAFLEENRQRLKKLLVEKISVLGDDDLDNLKVLIPQFSKVIEHITIN